MAFCQAAGTAVTQDCRMVGGGATAVVTVLDVACSAAGPLLHAAAATVRIATPTAPKPTRTAFDLTRGC
jgi:ATP-dependent protease ClpP protease subunit